MSKIARKRRSAGSAARRDLRKRTIPPMLPTLKQGLPRTEPLTQEQILRIDDESMKILEEVGCVFRDPIALKQWKEAGAKVVGETVYPDRGLIRDLIKSIPTNITFHARNPEHTVHVGERNSIFVPMTGAPYLRDLEDRRRLPTIEDLGTFHKLSQMMPAIHSSAHHIVEPMDLPVAWRHLHITYSSMKYSDKTFMGMTTSGKNSEDVLDMCGILFGKAYMETHAVVTGNVNGNSPLVWDETMLSALRAFASRNQPLLISPFVLGGANTPASVVPTVIQLNAEALVCLAYSQIVRKGTPVIYGHYLSTVSMSSGAPMAGTPEISLMNFMIGQMARYYDVPWRTSNTLGGAKTFDAQAGYESATTMMSILLSGANYLWHSAGWNEAGMHCSIAKFVVDSEQCAMGYRMAEGLRWDDIDEGLAAIRDIGPGGHYLGHPHTVDNFQRAFFMPELFDNNSIEQWKADGSKEITQRALEFAKEILNIYEEPKLDEAKNEELLAYIAKRESEIPEDEGLNQDY